ncbi:MAG: aminopeptidase [Lachnospiraceae bacterium]|nr:aminopeptidase [Lachnospiraceae bacterium]
METLLEERYQLSMERIREIPGERLVPEPYRDFFETEAVFLKQMDEILQLVQSKEWETLSLEEQRKWNQKAFEEILPKNYGHCYGNPSYLAEKLGSLYAGELGFLYAELHGLPAFVWENRIWDMEIVLELFLEIYHMFTQEELPEEKYVREAVYWYVSDYTEELTQESVTSQIDPTDDFAVRIIMDSDLSDPRYLYRYGEYVSENEEKTAAFLAELPKADIEAMASTYTEGYRIGFVNAHKPLEKKRTVNIRYTLGFERMVRQAILQFEKMGLKPVIYRSAQHVAQKSPRGRIGYYGAVCNPQYDYDHKNDRALFWDKDYITRKLRALQKTYEEMETLAAQHGGPACIEIFGEKPFVPVSCPEASRLSEEQQKLQVQYNNEAGQITNRYIIGEERSFTIIAYPTPAIGDQFADIFRETVRINTLDYRKYQRIQQCIIDVLDQGTHAVIQGMGENKTQLTIRFHTLSDPGKQTNFENCVADVNIPVGEVFTSPVLQGTSGTLHVSQVYLGEFQFQNLKLVLKDGVIKEYSCSNFDSEEENRRYIQDNILYAHPTLPIGEFAIGTNTTAYVMAEKYGIAGKLPILIAEKMGPHFAFGDTCYSWEEDSHIYNPDGKEIIAKENEISAQRRTNLDLAYYGCHTDITIPYDELGSLKVVDSQGTETLIIEKGRFVLPGTEELNEPFELLFTQD